MRTAVVNRFKGIKGYKEQHVLKDISFDVEEGDFFGILGRNGSGKSTLLKIISQIYVPEKGSVTVNGKLVSFIELGVGFNPELTGRENVYMNGALLGFTPKEIDAMYDDIVDFAELHEFMNQKLKNYSSGMQVRLAFSVAIKAQGDILILDEVLAVGDEAFQRKCNDYFMERKKSGKTTILVTHDMGAIIKYCDQVVVLNKGNFIAQGEPGKMVDLYKKILANQMDDLSLDLEEIRSGELNDFSGEQVKSRSDGNALKEGFMKDKLTVNPNRTEYGDKKAEIVDFGLLDERGNLSNLLLKGEYFTIKEKIQFHGNIESPIFTYTIKDKRGADLTGTNTMYEASDVESVKQGDVYEVEFKQKMTLQGGEYLLSMSCTGFENGEHVVYHRLYDIVNITVISNKNTVGIYDMEPKVSLKLHRDRG